MGSSCVASSPMKYNTKQYTATQCETLQHSAIRFDWRMADGFDLRFSFADALCFHLIYTYVYINIYIYLYI